MPVDAKALVARFDELKNDRSTWEAHWQDIADFGLGRREFTADEITPGRKRRRSIFDNTFMLASEMLGAGLHSLLSNPATRWFRLKFENADLMEIEEAAEWIALAEERLYNAFNRPEAGFSPAMHEAWTDIVNFGTGGVYISDGGPRGAIFIASPLSGLYLGENSEGRLDTYMWLRRLTAVAVVKEFGKGVCEKADKAVETARYQEPVKILRVVLPREDPQIKSMRATSMPWASYTIAVEDMKILRESGYRERPFAVGRWNKEAGEIYGRGPGVTALPEQRVLNEMRKTLLKAGQKRVDPALIVPSDGVVSQLQTGPGGVTVAKSAYMQGGHPPIWPMDSGSDIPIGIELLNLGQTGVRSAFHWELLQLIQDPRMTATQVIELSQNQQRVVSPILGRLQSEILEPSVERTFGIELRAGRLPPIPAVLAGENVKVEYISPAVRAQRMQDAQAVRRVLATAGEYSQFEQDVLHNIDSDEALRIIADAEGTPVSVMRSRADVETMREALRQQAMQQQALEEMSQVAAAAGKATPALKAIEGGAAA